MVLPATSCPVLVTEEVPSAGCTGAGQVLTPDVTSLQVKVTVGLVTYQSFVPSGAVGSTAAVTSGGVASRPISTLSTVTPPPLVAVQVYVVFGWSEVTLSGSQPTVVTGDSGSVASHVAVTSPRCQPSPPGSAELSVRVTLGGVRHGIVPESEYDPSAAVKVKFASLGPRSRMSAPGVVTSVSMRGSGCLALRIRRPPVPTTN